MAKAVNLSELLKIELPSPTIDVQNPNTGSITPTTHDGRKTFDFSTLPQGTANSEDLVTGREFFVDRFKYLDESKTEHEVMRYGIDTKKIATGQSGKHITFLGETFEAGIGGSTKSNKSENKLVKAKNVTHHSIEKLVFKNAVGHLLNDVNAKTVLVHILERDNDSLIKPAIGTHTVLLYKNPANADNKHEILVIDPNNFDFSMHLSSDDMVDQVKNYKNFNGIVVSGKGTQIYKAMGPQGPKADQYRDCADIAVKLAFGFNFGFNINPKLDMKIILDCPVVKALSNNKVINDTIPVDALSNGFIKTPFRAQHKSNVEIGLKLYDCSETVRDNIKKLDIVSKAVTLAKEHAKILLDDLNNVTTLNSLATLAKQSFDAVHEELNAEEILLLGQALPNFD